MAKVEIEVPDDMTILSGCFVYNALDVKASSFHGFAEYQDFDGLSFIGLLSVARHELIRRETANIEDPEEDE